MFLWVNFIITSSLKTFSFSSWVVFPWDYIDNLHIFQGYFQRILSLKSTSSAQILSVGAMLGCALMAVLPAFFGVIALGTGLYVFKKYTYMFR